MKHIFLWVAFTFLTMNGCNKIAGGGRNGGGGGSDPGSPSPSSVDTIQAQPLPRSAVNTSDSSLEHCVDVSFRALAKDVPVKGASVTFSIIPAVADSGSLTPSSVETDATGIATTKYCAGTTEMKIAIVAKIAAITANSGDITIKSIPDYELKFSRSDVAIVMNKGAEADADPVKNGVINLNIQDSGPAECANVVFTLSRKGGPAPNKVVKFRTQTDFPKGAKLAKRPDKGTKEKDGSTNKYFAVYEATSDEKGELTVPVCAGPGIGTVLISGTFTADASTSYSAQAPVVAIHSGFINWANMSITYDTVNAKTLRGHFNTNSDHVIKFKIKVNSKNDGDPNLENPVSVVAETGRIEIENGGFPNAAGEVPFTMQALHMVDYRPYQVYAFTNTEAQSRCDPEGLAASGGITYLNLSKNWRSTIVYMMRGQEYFNDANGNGVFDAGGDGFWDKNQNGIFDSGDVITFDAGSDGLVNMAGEWFIDLPSPFIDTNENGIYEPNIDVLVGDEYVAPNGKRDKDTTIWKYDYIPIYMGETSFALLHSEVDNVLNISSTDLADQYYATLISRGLLGVAPKIFTSPMNDTSFWGAAPLQNAAARSFFFLAHGACGNPVPGGVTVTANFNKNPTIYGERSIVANFYEQPEDYIREPSRRLLHSADSSSSAKIGFNILDHPASKAGYPISLTVGVGECTNECSGDVATAGVACGAHSGELLINVDGKTLGADYNFSSVVTCTCNSGTPVQGVCIEPPTP